MENPFNKSSSSANEQPVKLNIAGRIGQMTAKKKQAEVDRARIAQEETERVEQDERMRIAAQQENEATAKREAERELLREQYRREIAERYSPEFLAFSDKTMDVLLQEIETGAKENFSSETAYRQRLNSIDSLFAKIDEILLHPDRVNAHLKDGDLEGWVSLAFLSDQSEKRNYQYGSGENIEKTNRWGSVSADEELENLEAFVNKKTYRYLFAGSDIGLSRFFIDRIRQGSQEKLLFTLSEANTMNSVVEWAKKLGWYKGK